MRSIPTQNTRSYPKETKRLIHNIFILDVSGSMRMFNRWRTATNGISQLLESIKNDTYSNNTVSIVEFDSYQITKPLWFSDINFIPEKVQFRPPNGSTPLNDTIGGTIQEILQMKSPEDVVMINIFTDGGENASSRFTPSDVKKLIKDVEKNHNFTVTFQGTQDEVQYAINTLGMASINTVTHDNTEAGIQRTMSFTASARAAYSKDVSEGKLSTSEFYKDVK